MQDDQLMLILCLQLIIGLQHPIIELVKTGVAGIKLALAHLRIIQEETSTEVIDSLFSLRLELIGDKGHMIACLTEHLREERCITPFTTVANRMK